MDGGRRARHTLAAGCARGTSAQPLRSTAEGAIPSLGSEMTVSAGQMNGQWTLLEHLDYSSTRPVSVYDVGRDGDVWVSADGRSWMRPGAWTMDTGCWGANQGTSM
jgi:hypothetical protein